MIEDFREAEVGMGIVWIHMLPPDSEEWARKSARIIDDPRVRHFHDPNRLSGLAIGEGLGWKRGKVAWDIYLFYRKGAAWAEGSPQPFDWMHQLAGDTQADRSRYHTGEDLIERLHAAMGDLTAST